ncbi:hypothetical protein R078131_01512 [Convivina intestini]|nr:hypothetical protein R078131_01512 [Convivina intestini]
MTDKRAIKISKIIMVADLIWLGMDLFFYRSSGWYMPFTLFITQLMLYFLVFRSKETNLHDE